MTTELLLSSKSSGKVWELSRSAQRITCTTNRTGSPGTLKFTLIKAGDLSFFEGDPVRLSIDGRLIFYGWVFVKSKDRWGVIDVTCYDRLRYLKANASYAFYGQTAGGIITQIAEDLQLETGTLADTGYALPSYIQRDKACLDIIGGAVQQTLLNTGKVYVFFDSGGGLSLEEAGNMIQDVVIGEKSLLTDYTYRTDIDQQTYNSVKLARPNETTGRADVYIAQDSDTIARWGLLQLYQTVDGDANDAQLQAQAKTSLAYYNRRMRTLKVSSLGVPGLRAGQMVLTRIPGLGDVDLDRYVLLEKVAHTFESGIHTMEFETLIP